LIVSSLTGGYVSCVLRGKMKYRCNEYRIDLFDRISTDHADQKLSLCFGYPISTACVAWSYLHFARLSRRLACAIRRLRGDLDSDGGILSFRMPDPLPDAFAEART